MKTTGLFWCGFAHELHVTTSNIKLYIKRPSSVHGCPWLSGHRKVKHQRSSKLLTRHTNSQKSWSCVRKPPNKISKNKVSKYVHILSLLYINNWKTSQENKKCPKRPPPVYYYIFLVLNPYWLWYSLQIPQWISHWFVWSKNIFYRLSQAAGKRWEPIQSSTQQTDSVLTAHLSINLSMWLINEYQWLIQTSLEFSGSRLWYNSQAEV